METIVILTAIFWVCLLALLGVGVHGLLVHYLVAEEVAEEVQEEDGTVYTMAFERYWLWDGNKSGIPNIFHSDRVKPVAFATWQAAFIHLKKEVLS